MESIFGILKTEWHSFVNTGIRHTMQPDGSITLDQDAYIQNARTIKSPLLRRASHETVVDRDIHGMFWSLLGVIAYAVMTQQWTSVYVQALQRKAQAPCIGDVKALNKVTKALKSSPNNIIQEDEVRAETLEPKRLRISQGGRQWEQRGWSDLLAYRCDPQRHRHSPPLVLGLQAADASHQEHLRF